MRKTVCFQFAPTDTFHPSSLSLLFCFNSSSGLLSNSFGLSYTPCGEKKSQKPGRPSGHLLHQTKRPPRRPHIHPQRPAPSETEESGSPAYKEWGIRTWMKALDKETDKVILEDNLLEIGATLQSQLCSWCSCNLKQRENNVGWKSRVI